MFLIRSKDDAHRRSLQMTAPKHFILVGEKVRHIKIAQTAHGWFAQNHPTCQNETQLLSQDSVPVGVCPIHHIYRLQCSYIPFCVQKKTPCKYMISNPKRLTKWMFMFFWGAMLLKWIPLQKQQISETWHQKLHSKADLPKWIPQHLALLQV